MTPQAPIFVVGHPRSGTTLLASMLGRHPLIASTPESLFLTQARYDIRLSPALSAQEVARRAMRTPLSHLLRGEEAFAADLERAFAHGARDERTVFACALEHFRAGQGKARVLEKSPLHLRHLPELLDWFPDARILWIVRDGRACVASLQKVAWATHDAPALARQWVRNLSFGLAAEPRAGESLMTLRYEDLVTSPRDVMGRVCAHVGVPLDEGVFDNDQAVTTIKPSEIGWKENVLKPLQGERARAWERELSPADREAATAIMLPHLVRLGYESAPVPVARCFGAAIMSHPLSVSAMRTAFHLTRRATGAKQARKAARA